MGKQIPQRIEARPSSRRFHGECYRWRNVEANQRVWCPWELAVVVVVVDVDEASSGEAGKRFYRNYLCLP